MLFILHQMAMQQEKDGKQRLIAEARHKMPPADKSAPIIWILGGPGCGKGTQCDKIVEKYKFKHFSTGDLLRAEVASGSAKGQALQAIMKAGKLVSNEDVLDILQDAMVKEMSNASGFLIDGYPREKSQGISFEMAISPVDLIIFFDCSDETMVTRIKHRAAQSAVVRADDNDATIRTRLETFRKNTNEILEQYTSRTVIINGERGVDEIFADVVAAIDSIVEKKKVLTTC